MSYFSLETLNDLYDHIPQRNYSLDCMMAFLHVRPSACMTRERKKLEAFNFFVAIVVVHFPKCLLDNWCGRCLNKNRNILSDR